MKKHVQNLIARIDFWWRERQAREKVFSILIGQGRFGIVKLPGTTWQQILNQLCREEGL